MFVRLRAPKKSNLNKTYHNTPTIQTVKLEDSSWIVFLNLKYILVFIYWKKEWISDSKKLRNYILKIQIEQDLFRFAGVPALHTCPPAPLDNWHLPSESLFHTLTPNPHIVAWNRECHTQTCNRKWKSFTAPFVRKWKSNLCFILKSEKVIFTAS